MPKHADRSLSPKDRSEVDQWFGLLTPRQAKIAERFYGLHGHEPQTNVEVARALGIPHSNVSVFLARIKDIAEAREVPTPDRARNQLRERLDSADQWLPLLTQRQQDLVELLFGLRDGRKRTMAEAARELGMAKNGAHQALMDVARLVTNNQAYLLTKHNHELTPGLLERASEWLGELAPRQRQLVGMRYGLEGREPMSVTVIARELNMAHPDVSQALSAAVGKAAEVMSPRYGVPPQSAESFQALTSEDRDHLTQWFPLLTSRQAAIADRYWGLHGHEPQTQAEIAAEIRVDSTYVSMSVRRILSVVAHRDVHAALRTQGRPEPENTNELSPQ